MEEEPERNDWPEQNGPRRRLKLVPARLLVPTAMTVLALCAGLTAMRMGLEERWQLAVVAILIAGVLDFLDGRIARLLKGDSKFGAELDSLSDVVSFGVAPAMLLYNWSLKDLGGIGWVLALGLAVCCALRLARFNTMLESPSDVDVAGRYFIGVPAPAGAGIAILPLLFDFQIGVEIFRTPVICALFVVAAAFLMVSRLHTYSPKRIAVRRERIVPVLICVSIFTALLASYLWGTVALAGLAYVISIPFSQRRYMEERDKAIAAQRQMPR
jgi:CDP-diacylglycerol--serine O-phosphatidyltransferase